MTDRQPAFDESRLPVLRPPTEEEQRTFDKTGRWPDSYVIERLANLRATEIILARMDDPLEALRELNRRG